MKDHKRLVRSGLLQTTWLLRLQDQHLLEDLRHPGPRNLQNRLLSREKDLPTAQTNYWLHLISKVLLSCRKMTQDIIKLRPQRHFEPVSVDYDLWFQKKGANDWRPKGHPSAHDVRCFWVKKMPPCFSNQILRICSAGSPSRSHPFSNNFSMTSKGPSLSFWGCPSQDLRKVDCVVVKPCFGIFQP